MIITEGMGKILNGIMKYQSSLKGELVPIFREILDKPAPKSIILTCVDSRIVASRLFRAEPGAYFMLRNPGNFIQKFQDCSVKDNVPSNTPAAIELACVINACNTIAVVGHSDCKTINMLYSMRNNLNEKTDKSALKTWLKTNGKDTVEKFLEFEKSGFKIPLTFSEMDTNKFEAYIDPENKFEAREKFSQINTLEQLKNVKNYSFLKDRMKKHDLKSFALWLDVITNDVYMFSYLKKQFVKIDESTYEVLYKECETKNY